METVLAMAVMSLAVTVLLGLLPHGLEMSRKAGVSAGEARVTTDVLAELSRLEWATLPTYDKHLFYYDDQGVRVEAGADVAYVARSLIYLNLKLPGSAINSDDLRRAVIQIASSNNPDYDFGEGKTFSTYTSILSRMK